MYRDRVWQFLKKVQSIPPWPERQVEVLAQVEDVEGQPAHNEEEQGGQQQGGPPHIAPLTQHPSAAVIREDFIGKIDADNSEEK